MIDLSTLTEEEVVSTFEIEVVSLCPLRIILRSMKIISPNQEKRTEKLACRFTPLIGRLFSLDRQGNYIDVRNHYHYMGKTLRVQRHSFWDEPDCGVGNVIHAALRQHLPKAALAGMFGSEGDQVNPTSFEAFAMGCLLAELIIEILDLEQGPIEDAELVS